LDHSGLICSFYSTESQAKVFIQNLKDRGFLCSIRVTALRFAPASASKEFKSIPFVPNAPTPLPLPYLLLNTKTCQLCWPQRPSSLPTPSSLRGANSEARIVAIRFSSNSLWRPMVLGAFYFIFIWFHPNKEISHGVQELVFASRYHRCFGA
jgi:hypothetical protein